MRNLTVSMDDDTARWLRLQAAGAEMSMSRYLCRLVQREMQRDHRYQVAMARVLARQVECTKLGLGHSGAVDTALDTLPAREERYDRAVFRR